MPPRGPFGIPAPVLALTLAGLLPFIGGAVFVWMREGDPAGQASAQLILLAYSAIILSFLGGVRWGVEISRGPLAPPRWGELVFSVLGALAAWGLVLWPVLQGFSPFLFAAMAAALLLAGVWDVASTRELPQSYRRIRIIATAGAVASLLAAAVLTGS